MKKKEVLAAAIAARLTGRHGEVMVSAALADELKISPNALRLELSRGGDLPRPAPLPGKGHRWLSLDVADWLAERSSTAADGNESDDTNGRLDVHSHDVAAPRRPGRPRTAAAAGGAQ